MGRVVTKLKELDLQRDTVLIFTSDNGGYRQPPLRERKGTVYEGGLRVPLLFYGPERIGREIASDMPVTGCDLLPTMAAMAGLQDASAQVRDGESLVPLLTGSGQLKRQAVYWHLPIYGRILPLTPCSAIRKGDWKLIEFFEDRRLELYNLKQDIGETNSLTETHPARAAELHKALISWRKAVAAPVPTEKNPRYDPSAQPESRRAR